MTNRMANDDIQALKERAESMAPSKSSQRPVAGSPLPEGFKNPKCGNEGHFCIDGQGRYNPKWMQVIVHPTPEFQDNVFVGLNGKTGLFIVNQWFDYPPWMVKRLRDTKIGKPITYSVEPTPDNPFGQKTDIVKVPRFHFEVLPSAMP